MSWPHPFQTHQPRQLTQHLRDELQPLLLPEHQAHQSGGERQAQGKQSRVCNSSTVRVTPRPLPLSCFWAPPDPFTSPSEGAFYHSETRGAGTGGAQSSHSQGFPSGRGETESLEQEVKGGVLWRVQSGPHYSLMCPCTCVYRHSG